jgi:hypothetical protein
VSDVPGPDLSPAFKGLSRISGEHEMSAMHRGPIPYAFAKRIWRVLVEECGVLNETYRRESFICHIVGENGDRVYFWPFDGAEFYNNFFVWRVRNCRGKPVAMIAAANARLDELRREFMEECNDPQS